MKQSDLQLQGDIKMKETNTDLTSYCCINEFIKCNASPELVLAWEQLKSSPLQPLEKALNTKLRDELIKAAANTLPTALRPHARAKYLMLHLKDFKTLTLPYIENINDLTEFQLCLYKIFNCGSKIPMSDAGIYNILINKYTEERTKLNSKTTN